ncbi:MAG TPA: DUF4019 domain-containing protein [Syntrophales bacterium]|jgi:hypothetical protein|nr:DUF4019 domain-containing protein [Syntrophales bacterium]HPI58081.1 DUF4019 domain-containing protein [Syntrophales bacterium]HPN25297.1 DUF4019 domain-containing protein [Syntrophales bacterium]HQM29284.1 DUF4019 domain-containing protein [Syntrophales bacterium]
MKKTVSIILLLFLFGISHQAVLASQDKERTSEAVAKAWLLLVDEGKYSESWNETATYFKGAVTMDSWMKSMQSFRQPLGKVKSRKLMSKKYTKTLPGAPDGEYVVIQYRSSFENMKSALETITPMLDKDGKWKVSGYYIK